LVGGFFSRNAARRVRALSDISGSTLLRQSTRVNKCQHITTMSTAINNIQQFRAAWSSQQMVRRPPEVVEEHKGKGYARFDLWRYFFCFNSAVAYYVFGPTYPPRDTPPSQAEDMTANFPMGDPGVFNIGVLHTSASGAPGHEMYAPCSLDSLGLATISTGLWGTSITACSCHRPVDRISRQYPGPQCAGMRGARLLPGGCRRRRPRVARL
jgi:hypothetical protein